MTSPSLPSLGPSGRSHSAERHQHRPSGPVALRPRRAVRQTSLPGPGPVWFSTVMGTGILATLLGLKAPVLGWLVVPAGVLTVIAVVLLLGLSGAFIARVVNDRSVLTDTVRDAAVVPTWGTVSMGAMSAGSAVLTVAPQLWASTPPWALAVDAVLWTVGTALGVVTAFGFAAVLVRRDLGHPVPAWGLPIVPPMVSATTGAALVPHLPGPVSRLALLTVAVGCFVLSLFLGGLVFVLAYHHHWTTMPLPVPASVSAWIPLGIVGQSTAAAQALATQSEPLLLPGTSSVLHSFADGYGCVMLLTAVPVIAYAAAMTIRGFRAGMSFTPGWWALTFPIGTLALGSSLLGESLSGGDGWLPVGRAASIVGAAVVITLCVTWAFCTWATLRALSGARNPSQSVPRPHQTTP